MITTFLACAAALAAPNPGFTIELHRDGASPNMPGRSWSRPLLHTACRLLEGSTDLAQSSVASPGGGRNTLRDAHRNYRAAVSGDHVVVLSHTDALAGVGGLDIDVAEIVVGLKRADGGRAFRADGVFTIGTDGRVRQHVELAPEKVEAFNSVLATAFTPNAGK